MAVDDRRRAAIVAAIHKARLQALVTFSPGEVLLLSGYCPVMGASLAIVTGEGELYLILPEDEVELAQVTSDATLIAYQPNSLHRLNKTSEALRAPVAELSRQLHLIRGEIGTSSDDSLEANSYQSTNHFRRSIWPLLTRAFPECGVAPADLIIDQLKAVKTPIEIAQIRHASILAREAFRHAVPLIAPGRREDEVAAEIESIFSRVAHSGFERGRGYFFCMSGPNSAKAAGAYARTRSRVIEEGDTVMIHANTVGDGYWTDITRTFVAGEPDPRQQQMKAAIEEARAAALAAIAPGARASAVDEAARDILNHCGFGTLFKHATGHGVGFAACNPNARPRIHPLSPDVLEAGMTFNLEPAIYIDGIGGMRRCDVVACTASGAEVLTDF